MPAKKLSGAALAAHNAKLNRESGSRARSSSARSTRSRASSVGSRKSTRSRQSGVNTRASYTARFNPRNGLNPLNDEVHSFPSSKWHTKTAKVKQINASTVGVTADRAFVIVTSQQTQNLDNLTTPEVYVHNGTTNTSMTAQHPFIGNITTNSLEGIRRVSAALEIIYTGRADEAAGYFTICGGQAGALFDTQLELDTAAEIAVVAQTMAAHPDCLQIPVSAVAAAGSLVIVPKPISEAAEKWHNSQFAVPFIVSTTESEAGGWEQMFITCQGATANSSFLLRWHQIIEAKCGFQSPFQNFITGHTVPVMNVRQGEGLLQSFYRNMLESVGGRFSQYANEVGYSFLDKAASTAMTALSRRGTQLALGM